MLFRSIRALLLAAAFSLLAPSSESAAEPIIIDFDFSASTISALSGAFTVPPDGSITAGSARLSVQGSSLVTPLPGSLNLKSFVLGATLAATVTSTMAGSAALDGTLDATQIGTWNGTLSSMLTGGMLSAPLFLNLDLFVGCAGFLCGGLGDFPISSAGNASVTNAVTLMLANLSVNGSAMISGTLTVTLNGQSAVLNLVGNEVDRTFLPEPAALLQLAAGMAALVGLGWLRRRS